MKGYLLSKKTFFAALDRLDDPEDQSEEDKSWGNPLTADKEVDKPDPNKVALSSERIPLPRANSDPISSCDLQRKRSPVSVLKPTPANRPRTTETMPTIKSATHQKKRRIDNAKIIPDDQQIFKGLIFCKYFRLLTTTFAELIVLVFFPNNDVSPFRRLRIQRAQDYGARWSRDWATDVTHVIIDKGLLSNDLLSYLKLESLPVSSFVRYSDFRINCCRRVLLLSMNHTHPNVSSFVRFSIPRSSAFVSMEPRRLWRKIILQWQIRHLLILFR
jgi:DNA polymerase IV